MKNYLYVDDSNLTITAQQMSAVDRGLARNIHEARTNQLTDRCYRIDYSKLLLRTVNRLESLGRAVAYGSHAGGFCPFAVSARDAGFETVVHLRRGGREKMVDNEIATDMILDALELADPVEDRITLVSGDSDFVPAVKKLIARGFRVNVTFWSSVASELALAASRFTCLDASLKSLAI